jgi:protein tyrosine phosphatase (PTP) superfamily phosphohydrolase (DUF442 family)
MTRSAPRRRSWPWVICYGAIAGLLAVVGYEAAQGTLGGNFHTVIPGQVFRSAQPSARWLGQLVQDHGIRTVINLRGNGAPTEWYMEECRATHRLDVAQEDISLSATRLPSADEMRRLVEVLDHCEYPVLFHCFRGADRTGLASATAKLLYTDATLDQACRQLGICYGHVPIGKCANLDRFFELYADWLKGQGLEHAPEAFRRWIAEGYCPGECRCKLELLQPPPWLPLGKPCALALRAHNTSIKTWYLRAGNNAGIHAAFNLFDVQGHEVLSGRTGLFDAEVPPGQSIDLTLALPAVGVPGHYILVIDMVDEQHCNFFQTGSELLEWELEVREPNTASGG